MQNLHKKSGKLCICLVTSKYPPEYSGSGLRIHRTYKRLSEKFGIHFDVITSSVTDNSTKKYTYDGVNIYRIANKWNTRIPLKENDSLPIQWLKRFLNYLIFTLLYLWEPSDWIITVVIWASSSVEED